MATTTEIISRINDCLAYLDLMRSLVEREGMIDETDKATLIKIEKAIEE